MYKKIIFFNFIMLIPALNWAIDKDMLSDIMLRERAAESQVGKFLREEKKLDSLRGGVGIDVWGNRVRSEIYLLKPASNKLRSMLLTYREDSLNYSWVLTTYKNDLPSLKETEIRYDNPKVEEFNQIAWWKYSKDLENYAIRIELYASNEKDYVKEIFNKGFVHRNLDDRDELRFENYKRIINGITKAEMELLKNDTDQYFSWDSIPDEIKWTFTGGSIEIEEGVRGVPDKNFSKKIIFNKYETTNIKYGDDTWEKFEETQYDTPGNFWSRELIFTASEFEGRKIDLVSGGYEMLEEQRSGLLFGGPKSIPQKFAPGPFGPGIWYW